MNECMFNPIGILSLGILIGIILFNMIVLFIYRKSKHECVEIETGYVWIMKNRKVRSISTNKRLHVLESTYNGDIIVVDDVELAKMFKQ